MSDDGATLQGSTTREGFAVLGHAIKREPGIFVLSTLGSVLFAVLTVADAWVLGWSTDHVVIPAFKTGEIGTGLLWAVLGLFLGVAILRAVGIVARRLGAGIMQYRMQARTRRAVTRQYLTLPMEWHQRHPTGQLLSNANADVEATWAVMMPLPMAVGVVAMLVAAVVAMLLADVVLTIVGLVIFPLLFVINVGYQRFLSPRVTKAQSLRGDVSAVAHESFDGALVVKTLGREVEETERFEAVTDALRDANISAGRIRSVFDPILEALPNIGVLLVIVLGVERVMSGTTEPGDVVQVAYLFTVVGFPLRAFGWVLGELPRSVVGWDRVRYVLDTEGEMPYGTQRLPDGGALRLGVDGVDFGYRRGQRVLDDLRFEVEPGKVVAVVGMTGSGKSSLTSLLVRLLDPDSGRITLDGVDLRDLSHEAMSDAVALVPQQTFLFDDTVRDNVTLSAAIDDADVWDALRTTQADGFVAALPAGLDTELGERGTTLSGGQRQRLALARALVRRPRLLVMDDSTSALDPDVEQRILRALAEQTADGSGPTVLVVAYRKATIALADEVLFLADGRIVDRGTHAELVARSEDYRDLVDAYDQAREVQS